MKELIKYCIVLFLIIELFFLIKIGKIPMPTFLKTVTDSNRMLDGDTIYIHGTGRFNYKVLLSAKQIIEETYGVPALISEPITLTSDCFSNNSVDCDKCLIKFDGEKNKVVLTSESCYSKTNKTFINGLSEKYGNILIVNEKKYTGLKRVIIHEIGHNSGFDHCGNKNCVMSIDRTNDAKAINFCNNCLNKATFYELNKNYIKSLFN
jgi:hypothetical protein